MRGENETQLQIGMARRKIWMAWWMGVQMEMKIVSDMGHLRLTGMTFLLLVKQGRIWK